MFPAPEAVSAPQADSSKKPVTTVTSAQDFEMRVIFFMFEFACWVVVSDAHPGFVCG
jgi:hypothetical protein